MDRATVGIPTFFDVADAVKIRLRTVYTADGADILCDETDWFSPYVTD